MGMGMGMGIGMGMGMGLGDGQGLGLGLGLEEGLGALGSREHPADSRTVEGSVGLPPPYYR